jgi:tripartite-type tricarboxylate transporter receptor subunit TctC
MRSHRTTRLSALLTGLLRFRIRIVVSCGTDARLPVPIFLPQHHQIDAVTAQDRWRDIPDVPTLEELGIKESDTDTFQGLYAPAGTPQPIIERLANTLKEILSRPDVRAKYEQIGLPVVADGPREFRAVIERQVPMYKDVIDKAGLQVK